MKRALAFGSTYLGVDDLCAKCRVDLLRKLIHGHFLLRLFEQDNRARGALDKL